VVPAEVPLAIVEVSSATEPEAIDAVSDLTVPEQAGALPDRPSGVVRTLAEGWCAFVGGAIMGVAAVSAALAAKSNALKGRVSHWIANAFEALGGMIESYVWG